MKNVLNKQFEKDLLNPSVSADDLLHIVFFEAARTDNLGLIDWFFLESTQKELLKKGQDGYDTSGAVMRACHFGSARVLERMLTDPRISKYDISKKHLMMSGWVAPYQEIVRQDEGECLSVMLKLFPTKNLLDAGDLFNFLKKTRVIGALLSSGNFWTQNGSLSLALQCLLELDGLLYNNRSADAAKQNVINIVRSAPDPSLLLKETLKQCQFRASDTVFSAMDQDTRELFCRDYSKQGSQEGGTDPNNLQTIKGFMETLERVALLDGIKTNHEKRVVRKF